MVAQSAHLGHHGEMRKSGKPQRIGNKGANRIPTAPGGPRPTRAALAAQIRAAGLALNDAQLDRLWAYHQRLRAADEVLNLTRIRAFTAMVEKHYIDSILPGTLTQLPTTIMDLGSGGGLPGIPLAIAYPDRHFILVEGRRKRAGFLLGVVEELGLSNVQVVARKLHPGDCIPVDGVVTRAFSSAADILTRVGRSVRRGGLVLMLKGPNCDEEIATVATAADLSASWRLVQDIAYALPSGDRRRLLLYEKTSEDTVPTEKTVPTETSSDPASATAVSLQSRSPGLVSGPHTTRSAERITSPNNPRVKHWRQLLHGRGVRKHGQTLLSGERYITELMRERPDVVRALLVGPDATPPSVPAHVEVVYLSGALARALDPVGEGGLIAWLDAPPPPPWPPGTLPQGLTLVLPLQNPENVGAALRSAEAFGASQVLLTPQAASPYHPKALRAGGPAAYRLKLFAAGDLADIVAQLGEHLWLLDTHGDDLTAAAPTRPTVLALAVGLEGPGSAGVAAAIRRVTIPMAGRAESLNAAVAVGIALYVLTR